MEGASLNAVINQWFVLQLRQSITNLSQLFWAARNENDSNITFLPQQLKFRRFRLCRESTPYLFLPEAASSGEIVPDMESANESEAEF